MDKSTNSGSISYLRFWCHKVLPAVFDDSLSYYELLCKVVDKLNEVIDVANLSQEAWEAVYAEIERVETESKARDEQLQANIDANKEKLKADIADLQGQITSNDEDIEDLQNKCNYLQTQIDDLREELKKAYSTMMMYDPTTGRFTNSMNATRRMLQLLVSSDIAITCAKATANYTVDTFKSAGSCGDIINGSFKYNDAGDAMPYQTVDSRSLYSFDEVETELLDVETLAIPPSILAVKKKDVTG